MSTEQNTPSKQEMLSSILEAVNNDLYMLYIIPAASQVNHWCEKHKIPEDHALAHALNVLYNAMSAIDDFPNLKALEVLIIMLAALLHDIDDRKYTPSKNYDGARMILERISFTETFGIDAAEKVILLISLVSCSKNGNTVDPNYPLSFYIPRDADRLESLGHVGIKRAYETIRSLNEKRVIKVNDFNTDTARIKTLEELDTVATKERFNEYSKTGNSNSLVDHFYDKLLHTHYMSSGSKTLQGIADERRQIMIDFVLEFGRTGSIDWNKWSLYWN